LIYKTEEGVAEMKRLLIVDDEDKIREVIKEYAEFSGYVAEEAADGMSAIGMVKLNDYDLIIMDVMMPKLDGFSAVKEIQKIKNIPVIMLSARGEEYDKLFGFELGIDDYVVKPFSPKELMARVNAVLSRVDASDKSSQTIERFDGLEVNFAARTISVDGKRIELTPKEYDLLFYMIQNKNIALSRDRLLSDIWGYDFFGDDRTIDTHVKNLRNSLGPYRKFIVTLRGVGYKFEYEG
jgi:DNA-binding response OmpR family regulator